MRRHHLLLILVACVPPEQGIDNTRVVGEVRIEPSLVAEDGDTHQNPAQGQELPELYVGPQVVSGSLADETDADAFRVTTRLTLPDEVFEIRLADPGARALVELLDQGGPLGAVEVTGSGEIGFPEVAADSGLPETGMLAGVRYAVRITALTGPVGYEIVMPGAHPADVGVLLGAWSSGDVTARGDLLGGAEVTRWRGGGEEDAWVWTGRFEAYLVRSVSGEGTDLQFDEGAREAYLFAGDWPSLNSPLSSGTWYSSEPAHVTFPKEPPESTYFADAAVVRVEEPLVLDTFAEVQVLQEFDEGDTEPNGLQAAWPPAADLSTAADVNDAGMLSAPGFGDVFRGTITYGPEAVGYTHDSDAWKFQVPEPCQLILSLTWEDAGACLDAYVVDAVDGVGLDYAVDVVQPDVAGGLHVYEPGVDYYLLVLGYLGAPEGASTDYELLVEVLPP